VSAPPASSFTFEPLFLALGVVVAVAYGLAALRERAAWWRIALFALSLALIVGALNSPLETIAVHYLLLVHLLKT
jgi:cytochrome c oxidase assembly factor CtaG